jgi:hypothetical protein
MTDVTFEFPTEWALCPDKTSTYPEPSPPDRLATDPVPDTGQAPDASRLALKPMAG